MGGRSRSQSGMDGTKAGGSTDLIQASINTCLGDMDQNSTYYIVEFQDSLQVFDVFVDSSHNYPCFVFENYLLLNWQNILV